MVKFTAFLWTAKDANQMSGILPIKECIRTVIHICVVLMEHGLKVNINTSIKAIYLELKKIKNYGARYSFDTFGNPVLVVPLRTIKNEVQAVQYIKEDGEKRIHGVKRGNFHLIGEIKEDKPIHVAEGYATAASIYEALDMPIVVAFDCGNIDPVLAALKSEYPKHQIIIAADDDRETNGNPGKTKAEEAAKGGATWT